MGNIGTGNKEQSPGSQIGGSTGTSGFSADLSGLGDLIGKSQGMPALQLVNLQPQPQPQ